MGVVGQFWMKAMQFVDLHIVIKTIRWTVDKRE